MKILIITNTIKPDSGWGRYSKSVLDEYSNLSINYATLTEGDGLLPTTSVINFLRNCFRVRKMARSFDIIHAFDGWPFGVYAWFATLNTKKKFFINAIGTYSVAPLQDFLKGFLLKLAYRKANAVFPISNFVKDRILKYVDLHNIHTVYLASSELPKLEIAEVLEYKEKYKIGTQTPVLLTVGEIKDRKGQYEVVEAVNILKEKYPDILYIIVGLDKQNPAYTKKIREYSSLNSIEKNVKIVSDAKSDKELSFFYTIADIFILNAKQDERHLEGFGIVMLEAASFGKPVIGVALTALEETMKDDFNGLLIRDQTPDGIAKKIESVWSQKEKFGSNSFTFQESFSWKKTVSEYVKYYNK